MRYAWNAIILICSLYNSFEFAWMWQHGEPAPWTVWMFAIALALFTALTCLKDILTDLEAN